MRTFSPFLYLALLILCLQSKETTISDDLHTLELRLETIPSKLDALVELTQFPHDNVSFELFSPLTSP